MDLISISNLIKITPTLYLHHISLTQMILSYNYKYYHYHLNEIGYLHYIEVPALKYQKITKIQNQ